MNGDPLEYWELKHNMKHDGAGYDPKCPFCNPEVMKEIMEEA